MILDEARAMVAAVAAKIRALPDAELVLLVMRGSESAPPPEQPAPPRSFAASAGDYLKQSEEAATSSPRPTKVSPNLDAVAAALKVAPATPHEISKRTGVSLSNVKNALVRMKARGLVQSSETKGGPWSLVNGAAR